MFSNQYFTLSSPGLLHIHCDRMRIRATFPVGVEKLVKAAAI